MRTYPPIDDVAKLLAYDPDTGLLQWKVWRPNGIKVGSIAGSKHPDGYIFVSINDKVWPAHRIAWGLHFGDYPKLFLDHINGDKSDNRISNLREVTKRENARNAKRHRAGHAAYVAYLPRFDAWVATVRNDGVEYRVGTYDTQAEAIAAQSKAERSLSPGMTRERVKEIIRGMKGPFKRRKPVSMQHAASP